MRSYFSQLVKQSNLRIAAEGKPHSLEKKSKDSEIKPLHQEKTILVSLDAPDSKSEKSFQPNNFPKQEQTTPADKSPLPTKADRQPALEKSSEFEKPILETFDLQTTETSREGSLKNPPADAFGKDFQANKPENLQVVEEVVFMEAEENPKDRISEPKKTEEYQKNRISEAEKTEFLQDSEASEISTKKDEAGQKAYFKKTGEILEGSEATPEEIHQIFLSEIHEWVADSPVLKEDNKKTEKQSVTTVRLSPPMESEAIAFRESSEHTETNRNSSHLEEQNLSLSIGTISIVIEDSEKDVQSENLPQKSSAQNTSLKPERKFSRLSRHYL